MVKVSDMSAIQQKIAKLTQDVTYFERCIDVANRQKSNGELFSDILKRCLWVLPLRGWVGYWQGNHRTQELIGMTAFSPEEISQSYFKNLNERIKYEQELLAA